MAEQTPGETASGAQSSASRRIAGSVADAVRIATEASLAPPVKPPTPRRESSAAGKVSAPKLIPAAYDSSPAPLAAPALADAFVPSPTPKVPVSAVETASAATAPITTKPITTKMEKVMTTAEEMMSFQQGNFEALMKSGQIWAAGLQDLGRHWAASAQAHIDETMGTVKAMSGIKSLREAVELQSTLARSSVEKAVSEGGKLTDASLKLAEQTLAPITARLTLAAERFGRTG